MEHLQSKIKIAAGIFFTVSFLDVVGVAINHANLQMICKPLIIPSLMYLYYINSEKPNLWFMTALFFSFLGDVFLLDKSNMFLYGIASFLITQLLYIIIVRKELEASKRITKIIAALPFIIFFTVLIGFLKPGLGDFLIPVVIYGLTISAFGMVSLLNFLIKKDKSASILLVGAVLFIVSDSMIALGKFDEAKSFYPVAIMITYITAQYLIYRHMISTVRKQ